MYVFVYHVSGIENFKSFSGNQSAYKKFHKIQINEKEKKRKENGRLRIIYHFDFVHTNYEHSQSVSHILQ